MTTAGVAELAALWQPLMLGDVQVPNRVLTSAMTLQFGREHRISDRHVHFYRERARGGVGLVFSEQLTASRENESGFHPSLRAYDRDAIPGYARIVEALRPYDTRFFAQLFAPGAAGASAAGLEGWSPLRAPSRIGAPEAETPLPLSAEDIAALVEDFGRSAINMREAGVHGVEIHGSHGWLVGQFLSPFYNRRSDAYGGSVANRCRFAIEVGTAIRRAVGAGYPLGIALTYDELMGDAGITPEDTLEQIRVLDAAGLFDFYDLSIGSSLQQHHTLSSMFVPHGYALPFAARARALVEGRAAILVAGRVVDPLMAARAVAAGHADMVAMSRAHIADPHLLRKARAGEHRLITRCVGANVCIRRSLAEQPVGCVVNPVAGREGAWSELRPSEVRRRIAVVGAGPAGLRFAVTAARRGHEVTLYEREGHAGGHLSRLATLPTRAAWSIAIEDLVEGLKAAGGRLVLNQAVSADELPQGRWDAIVVATGSNWDRTGATSARCDREGIPGLASATVLSPNEAIDRLRSAPATAIGKHVLVIDGMGSYLPLGLADRLSADGARVTLVTPHAQVGRSVAGEQELPHIMPKLLAQGVSPHAATDVESVAGRVVALRSVWGGRTWQLDDVDAIVLANARLSEDMLFQAWKARHAQVHAIGDAVSPRSLEAVVFEAEELARRI